MPGIRRRRTTAMIICSLIAVSGLARACPFCPAPEPSLSELIEQSDCVLLVRWTTPARAESASPVGNDATFSVVGALRQLTEALPPGTRLLASRPSDGSVGDLYLLTGVQAARVEWNKPLQMTEAGFRYVSEAPSRDLPPAKRLPYYLAHLEHADAIISNDAFSEFAAAAYSDVESLASTFSPADLRRWISRTETQQTRIGFYGMLLGLCGSPADAAFLKAELEKPSEVYRLGFDGLLAGYVLLTGDEGLPLLEQKLVQRNELGFAESYAAMQTLRFLWQFDQRRTTPGRLRLAMRLALQRPELTDLAIKDLTRWEDWELLPSLIRDYDSPGENAALKRRAIIQYLMVLSKQPTAGKDPDFVGRVESATAFLATLAERDPKAVADARKYQF